jgi:hypothetical protein
MAAALPDDDDPTAPARGCLVGLGLGAACLALLGLAFWAGWLASRASRAWW